MIYHRLKIFAPLDKPEEALPLIKAGADEFYCGVLIDNESLACWKGDNSKSNLPNLAALQRSIKIVRKNKKRIFLALNQTGTNPRHKELLERYREKIERIGLDGVIVTNLELLDQLKNWNLKIIAGSHLETRNEETVRLLLKNFRVKRIIFDRQITLADIKDIVHKFPGTEFEVFIMLAACRNFPNVCPWGSSVKAGRVIKKKFFFRHPCFSEYSIKANKGRLSLSSQDKRVIAGRLTFAPFFSCGACALFQFKKFGITSVKIAGRGYPFKSKIAYVGFIRKAIDTLEKIRCEKEFHQKTEKLFEKTFGKKCHRKYCYYPHFFNE